MFPCLPTRGNIVAETKFAPLRSKNVSYQIQKHLMFPYVSHQCFLVFAHSWKHGETLVGNDVSATMFPSLPRALTELFMFNRPSGKILGFQTFVKIM
jgi:hypothetical protein